MCLKRYSTQKSFCVPLPTIYIQHSHLGLIAQQRFFYVWSNEKQLLDTSFGSSKSWNYLVKQSGWLKKSQISQHENWHFFRIRPCSAFSPGKVRLTNKNFQNEPQNRGRCRQNLAEYIELFCMYISNELRALLLSANA